MSECRGRITVATNVNREMRDLLERDAEMLGVYQAEVVREALDNYANLRRGDFVCPHCENTVQIEP